MGARPSGRTDLQSPAGAGSHRQGSYRVAPRNDMNILYLLIPLALLLLGVAVWVFFWAVGSGQFDDLDTPAMRVIMDDDEKPPEDKSE